MKRALRLAAVCLFAALIAAALSLPLIARLADDRAASRLARSLASLPLPPHTEVREVRAFAGKLVGSGNGVQLLGAVLLQSELSEAELRDWYTAHAANGIRAAVAPQDGARIALVEHGEAAFDCSPVGGGYFLLYAWGSAASLLSKLDLRGH